MRVYPIVHMGSRNTVEAFLGYSGLRPRIQNPSVAIPLLLDCNGIIHYTRSGTRTVVSSGDFELEESDFLIVASECSSGEENVISITFIPTDYAFIMGSGDDFYTSAKNYMNRRPSTTAVDSCSSLESVLQTLCTGSQITTTINNALIVSHARGEGMLFFRLNAADADRVIYLDELGQFIDAPDRTQITDRILRNASSTNVHIRGCNIGKERRYLELLQQIFGSDVTVTAPKHFDVFGYFLQGGDINVKWEYMMYDFTVHAKDQIGNKIDLIQLFNNQGFSDIHGNAISEEKWALWIPDSFTASRTAPYECSNPIHDQMGSILKREYRYHHQTIYTFTINYQRGATVPTSQEDRIADLRQCLGRVPELQESYPTSSFSCPQYERWGFQSIDDMVDSLHWTITGRQALTFTGKRHEYQLRIPITNSDNVLMCNVLPSNGDREYQRNDIQETDSRFFGGV